MMVTSSRSRALVDALASRSLAAAFIDVRGVLNSCASASSTVARNSLLCCAASARAVASWERARSSPMAARFAIECNTVSLSPTSDDRNAANGRPAELNRNHDQSGRVAQRGGAPGDVTKLRLDRRQLRRAGPRHGVGALIVETDSLQLECLGNVTRNRSGHRRAALGEQKRPAERVQTLQVALPPRGVDFPLPRPARELTGDDRGHQERDKRHPVLRIGDREGSRRRQEEEVEAQNRKDRCGGRFDDAPRGGDEQNRDQIGERDRRRVDVEQLGIQGGDERDCANRSSDTADRDDVAHTSEATQRKPAGQFPWTRCPWTRR